MEIFEIGVNNISGRVFNPVTGLPEKYFLNSVYENKQESSPE